MEIIHIGHASFRIRGKKAILVTDPFDPEMVGLKFPKTEADIVTISHFHPDHSHKDFLRGEETVFIEGPGEYEVKNVKIIGITSFHDEKNGAERGKNTIYRIDMDGISIVHLGDLGHKLGEETLEILDGVDVLMIPVGGVFTIGPSAALQVVNQLEPRIVIPMHYLTEKINRINFGKLSGVSLFLKEMGNEGVTPQPKLNIIKDKIPTEQTVVILE